MCTEKLYERIRLTEVVLFSENRRTNNESGSTRTMNELGTIFPNEELNEFAN